MACVCCPTLDLPWKSPMEWSLSMTPPSLGRWEWTPWQDWGGGWWVGGGVYLIYFLYRDVQPHQGIIFRVLCLKKGYNFTFLCVVPANLIFSPVDDIILLISCAFVEMCESANLCIVFIVLNKVLAQSKKLQHFLKRVAKCTSLRLEIGFHWVGWITPLPKFLLSTLPGPQWSSETQGRLWGRGEPGAGREGEGGMEKKGRKEKSLWEQSPGSPRMEHNNFDCCPCLSPDNVIR